MDGVVFQTHTTLSAEPRQVSFNSRTINVYSEQLVLTITNDITDLKRAEAELVAREAQLRGITDNIPGIVFQLYVRDNGDMGL